MTKSENNNEEGKLLTRYEIWQPFLLSVMMTIGILIGYKMNDKSERLITSVDAQGDVSLGRVEEIIRFIEARYVDPLASDSLVEAAINGIIQKLDPHSLYLSPDQLTDVSENMEGSFKGIGIESFYIEDTVLVIKVVKDSPADRAGLKQLDQIIAIDDSLVAGVQMPFEKIRGKLKTQAKSVKLEIKRKGQPQTLFKTVTLDQIVIHSADVAYMVDDTTGYIQIRQFSSNTYAEFMQNLEKLIEKQGMKHLILDLRGNPGGYLPQATKIVNQLIEDKDRLIVYTEGRNHQRQDYLTNGKTFFDVGRIAVLVDEYSASGSEVIAGAIQDHDRGIIVGRRTYGKGLVQEQFALSNGGALRLTTARYYTPAGRSIQKEITPVEIYEDEVVHRSVFEPRKNDPTGKQKQFKTLRLSRPVFAGGGIDPEVFIPGDSLLFSADYLHLQNNVIQFLCTSMLRGKLSLNQVPDYHALADDFFRYMKARKHEIKVSSAMMRKAEKMLAENFLYLKNNGDAVAQAREEGRDDAFMRAALNYTSSAAILK
ncbi:MAG: S41 family peptidase [Saprospiraceae bacterium]|nr:S41 family peptidase [Saprospiraceae bacterium]